MLDGWMSFGRVVLLGNKVHHAGLDSQREEQITERGSVIFTGSTPSGSGFFFFLNRGTASI